MPSFLTWIKKSKYITENSPKGDIVRDILQDNSFPHSKNKNVILNYMESFFDDYNSYHYFDDFKEIYNEYLNSAKD